MPKQIGYGQRASFLLLAPVNQAPYFALVVVEPFLSLRLHRTILTTKLNLSDSNQLSMANPFIQAGPIV